MRPGVSRLARLGVRAFTLIEVVLAILIMVGMMVVLLFFYQRMTETRNLALAEAEDVATMRLLMDQLTTELRLARASSNPILRFEGTSNTLSFHTVVLGSQGHGLSTLTPNRPGEGDLRRVEYSMAGGTNLAEARGIARKAESPFSWTAASEETSPLGESLGESGTGDTNAEPSAVGGTNGTENASIEMGGLQPAPDGLLTERVRFLGLRYWNGAAWRENWSDTELPSGVEITLGRDPLRDGEMDPESALDGVFRRVVHLPGAPHPASRLGAGGGAAVGEAIGGGGAP